jgi:hypothetical protein
VENIGKPWSQVAAEAGCTPNKARLAVYLSGLAKNGKTIEAAAQMVRRKPDNIKLYAREFMIDFPDYRPFERYLKKGKPRPEPKYQLEAA